MTISKENIISKKGGGSKFLGAGWDGVWRS